MRVIVKDSKELEPICECYMSNYGPNQVAIWVDINGQQTFVGYIWWKDGKLTLVPGVNLKQENKEFILQ